MTTHDAHAVRAALRRVWPDPATADTAEIRALSGGLNPRSFLAVAGQRRCVLRVPMPGAAALLDLATEARAMRAAAASGIAPAVVGVDEVEGLLLTEYRGGVPWVPETARHSLNITRIAALLRALHAVAVDLPVFAAERIVREYLAVLDASGGATLSRAESDWADELLRVARHYDTSYSPIAFCHNDLVATNVLDNGAALLLVDFEYAVRSAPLLDLASLAGMNDYTEVQRRELLFAYYGDSASAATAIELDNAVRMVRLLALFWARVGEQRGGRKDAYAELVAHLSDTLK